MLGEVLDVAGAVVVLVMRGSVLLLGEKGLDGGEVDLLTLVLATALNESLSTPEAPKAVPAPSKERRDSFRADRLAVDEVGRGIWRSENDGASAEAGEGNVLGVASGGAEEGGLELFELGWFDVAPSTGLAVVATAVLIVRIGSAKSR